MTMPSWRFVDERNHIDGIANFWNRAKRQIRNSSVSQVLGSGVFEGVRVTFQQQ